MAYFGREDRPKKFKPLVNDYIPYRFRTVRVIRPDGTSTVESRDQALREAESMGLDLFCVSPDAVPPVCKIVNYGKYAYDQKKKEKEIAKNHKESELKEIRFTPLTDEHDLQTKANQAIKFLQKGNKLKATIFLKGRLITRMETTEQTMNQFIALIGENGFVEKKPTLEGKYYFCYISPKSKK